MKQNSQNCFLQFSVVLIGSVLSFSTWANTSEPVQQAKFIDGSDKLTVAAWGDVDSDGDTDAWTFGDTATIWLNDGSSQFSTPIRTDGLSVSFGDLDGDGDLDAWVSYSVYCNSETLMTSLIYA